MLRDDGTWWLNLGDSYASDTKGSGGKNPDTSTLGRRASGEESLTRDGKMRGVRRQMHDPVRLSCGVPPKSLLGVPWRVALALQADGWILRAAIPWIKANPMPESVRDRPTVAHEYVFLLAKQTRYFWDADAVRACWADERAGWSQAKASKFSAAASLRNDGGVVARSGHAGRNLRTSDFFHAGIDAIEDFAEHARNVRENGGLMLSPDGDPLAFLVNPVGSKLAHFAMWPPRLVAPMIRASTSEKGCCPTCGAPWTRVIDCERFTRPTDYRRHAGESGHNNPTGRTPGSNTRGMPSPARKELGFLPSCSCPPADPVPCRVVDIFGGSGTTAQVARALGRDCDLVELMAKNLPIIEQRLRDELDPETMKPVKRPMHRRTPSQITLLNDEPTPAATAPR